MKRAILSVPAHKPQWEKSARESGALVMWDLEDGVPGKRKNAAWNNLPRLVRPGDLVRINPGEWVPTDGTMVVPKVYFGTDYAPSAGDAILIETPSAVRDVHEILDAFLPSLVIFGWVDLLALSGLTPASTEYLDACRSRVVLACRSAGVPVYDAPVFGDSVPYAERAKRFGFDGVGCIHPKQVPGVMQVFGRADPADKEFLSDIQIHGGSLPKPLSKIEGSILGNQAA